MVPKRVTCRLDQIMKGRGLTQQDLAKLSGVDEKRIRNLCSGRWQGVTRPVLGKLCAALELDIDELFEARPADIWFPVRRDRKLTVHLGSTSLEARGTGPRTASIDRLGIGTWDVRGLFRVYEYLQATTVGGVVFDYAEHADDAHDAGRVEALFRGGNHLIFGSPLVNPIAEDVVCRVFGVPPRDRSHVRDLPYRFRWERPKESAFGELAGSTDPGIFGRDENRLVGRRTVIATGENGEDCGLLFTFRHDPTSGRDDEASDDGDCIIVAIMGHSGCGTLGGTELVCTDDGARTVYPERRNVGVLHAFGVTYRRDETRAGFDNRDIVSYALVRNASA